MATMARNHVTHYEATEITKEVFREEGKRYSTVLATPPPTHPSKVNKTLPHVKPIQHAIANSESVAITAKPPIISAEQPIISAEQPIISAEQPIITAEQPNISAEQPIISAEQHNISAEQPNTSAESPIIRADPPIISAEPSVQDSNIPSKEKYDISKTSDAFETTKSEASKQSNSDRNHKAGQLPKSQVIEIEVHSSQRGSEFEEKGKLPLKSNIPTPKLTKTPTPTSDKEAGKSGAWPKNPNRQLQKSEGAESTSRSNLESVDRRHTRQQSNESKRKRGKETTTPTSQIKVIRIERSDYDHPPRFNH